VNNGKLTRGGDLSSGIHDNIKQVPNRRIVIIEVVRSRDGRRRIRSQIRGGSGTKGRRVDGDVPGRYVVFVTSIDRDVVSLRSLQNESHDLVYEAVHILAPCRWGVKKIEEPTWFGVSGQTQGVQRQKPYPLGSRGQQELHIHHDRA